MFNLAPKNKVTAEGVQDRGSIRKVKEQMKCYKIAQALSQYNNGQSAIDKNKGIIVNADTQPSFMVASVDLPARITLDFAL